MCAIACMRWPMDGAPSGASCVPLRDGVERAPANGTGILSCGCEETAPALAGAVFAFRQAGRAPSPPLDALKSAPVAHAAPAGRIVLVRLHVIDPTPIHTLARRLELPPVHERLLLRAWLLGHGLERFAATRGAPFSVSLMQALPELQVELDRLAMAAQQHASADGSRRLVIRLADGKTVESVWLARQAICISTQVGCAVGCSFCRTGMGGLERNLHAAEIAAQVVLARKHGHVTRRVVLMGMGEPIHNLEAVLQALELLGGEGQLGHKELVFSTVGDPRAFERLAAHHVRPSLALSLHTLDEGTRRELLPRAPRIEPRALLEGALRYCERITWPLLVQWTLLEGINDSPQQALELSEQLKGRRALVNYIPWNVVAGTKLARPAWERGVQLVRTLRAQGVLATLRRSGAQDVDGGCGQLRARTAPATAPVS